MKSIATGCRAGEVNKVAAQALLRSCDGRLRRLLGRTALLLVAALLAFSTVGVAGALAAHAHHGARASKKSHRRRLRHFTQASSTPAPSTPAQTVCADTQLVPSAANRVQVLAATLCLVNRERAAHNERALQANADLTAVAQAHTDSMLARDYVEHVGPEGSTPQSRIEASGYIHGAEAEFEVAENIGWGTAAQATPAAVVARWMASPSHRENILTASYRDSGIGLAPRLPSCLLIGTEGAIYTQDFGVTVG